MLSLSASRTAVGHPISTKRPSDQYSRLEMITQSPVLEETIGQRQAMVFQRPCLGNLQLQRRSQSWKIALISDCQKTTKSSWGSVMVSEHSMAWKTVFTMGISLIRDSTQRTRSTGIRNPTFSFPLNF